jgi:hypothetical protein
MGSPQQKPGQSGSFALPSKGAVSRCALWRVNLVLRVDDWTGGELTRGMRLPVALLCGAVGAGCAGNKSADSNDPWRALKASMAELSTTSAPPAAAKSAPAPRPIVTPSNTVKARVMSVNLNGGFVVLNFPIGGVPGNGRRLSVYRGGLKVAEVRVGDLKPIDFNVVADIMAGECQIGDEVRDP